MKLFSSIFWGALLTLTSCSTENDESRIEQSGTIEATEVIVTAKTQGEVLDIFRHEGQKVSKQDTVLVLDHSDLDIQLKQTKAAVKIAQAKYDLMLKGARNEDINQADQMLNQAKVNYELAKKDFDRIKELYESESVTKKMFDDSKGRLEVAESQLKSAEQNFKKVKSIIRNDELLQAEGNLELATASMEMVQKKINDSYITAPIDGIIGEQFVEIGEFATPMSALFRINKIAQMELIIYVPEIELPKIKIGQTAQVFIDAFEDRAFDGTVTYISPESEFTPKNIQTKDERTKLVFAVKIKIDNKDSFLKAGIPADAIIEVD
ncbi:MAG: efflux RND transporter periplasmic adaptor subunit [Melioribacteraceae bacterium]|nr:efflux RND transporter periplasmic adaptor subunit [Melioribacteraceae bacterium]MCF8262929.1 efflux RND transporter periplasmic adaptor subunit [Melioribacteraceae bacterium]MCF8431094.1 efflux RND transporter periplasmic adaptor subunit [Melioribacteraceae bacterium]